MITKAQQEKIDFYKSEFNKNVDTYSSYGSDRVAHFGVFVNNDSEGYADKNVTIVQNVITEMVDYQLFSEVMAFLIEEDGKVVDLYDVFPATYVSGYLKNLKKIM